MTPLPEGCRDRPLFQRGHDANFFRVPRSSASQGAGIIGVTDPFKAQPGGPRVADLINVDASRAVPTKALQHPLIPTDRERATDVPLGARAPLLQGSRTRLEITLGLSDARDQQLAVPLV